MASKELERFFVDGFLKSFPEFQFVTEREAPDFILQDTAGLIGLEVVQLFRDPSGSGSATKKIEARRQRVLADLATRYYADGGRPISVTALMQEASLGDLKRLSTILRSTRPDQAWAQVEVPIEEANAKLYVRALPDQAVGYSQWQCSTNSVGWVRPACRELVEPVVAGKAAKLASYRKAVERVALLLVVDSTRSSGMVEWPDGLRLDRKGFEAVYLFPYPDSPIRVT